MLIAQQNVVQPLRGAADRPGSEVRRRDVCRLDSRTWTVGHSGPLSLLVAIDALMGRPAVEEPWRFPLAYRLRRELTVRK